MEKKNGNKQSCWKIFFAIIIILAIILGFLFVPRFFSSNTIKITRVEKRVWFAWTWADVWVDGWKEIHYYTFRYYVDIKNSKATDASNLKLVVKLKVDNSTVKSDTRTIRTLKAGESKTIQFHWTSIPHIYLYDEIGNPRDMISVIILYSGNEVLDRKAVT